MNRIWVMFCFLLLLTAVALGQTKKQSQKSNVSYYHKARPKQGINYLMTFLNKNLHYPDAARETNIDGKVLVRFVVDENGSVTDVEVLRGIGGGCDEEAKRVVALMPKWIPATYRGHPAKSVEILPVIFKLE